MTEPYQLFSSHLDGHTLTPAEAKRLSNWVAASPANAALVVDMAIVHECIDSRMCMPQILEELALADDVQLRTEISHSLDALWSTIEDSPRVLSKPLPSRNASASPWMIATGVAAMLLVCMIAYSLLAPTPPAASSPIAANAPAETPTTKPRETDRTPPAERPALLVATIDAAVDAKWSKSETPQAGGVLLQDEVFELLEGVLQVRTIVGHTIVLQGPARVQFESPQRVQVLEGKVAGLVGEHSGSLEFVTPTARIVDLGTELGVGVDEDLSTTVAVYDGAVQVSNNDDHASKRVTLLSGYEMEVDAHGRFLGGPRASAHDREFVRTDEVKLMLEGEAGQQRSEAIARYYELLRSGHLLAYQSFDKASNGNELSFGFAKPALTGSARQTISADLIEPESAESGALFVTTTGFVVSHFDIDALKREGLADEQGIVSPSGQELWISWREQSLHAPLLEKQYAGMSLTTNELDDTRDVFFGRVHGRNAMGIQMNGGQDAAQRPRLSLRIDADEEVHQWTVRLRFNEQGGVVSIWRDVPIAGVSTTDPQLEGEPKFLAFDRLRFVIDEQIEGWLFDDIMVAKSLESLVAAEELLSGELEGGHEH